MTNNSRRVDKLNVITWSIDHLSDHEVFSIDYSSQISHNSQNASFNHASQSVSKDFDVDEQIIISFFDNDNESSEAVNISSEETFEALSNKDWNFDAISQIDLTNDEKNEEKNMKDLFFVSLVVTIASSWRIVVKFKLRHSTRFSTHCASRIVSILRLRLKRQ